jgi:hypothetical protein
MMPDYQFWTLVSMIAGSFGYMFIYFNKKFDKIDEKFAKIDERLSNIDRRLTIVETILSVMGYYKNNDQVPKH